MIKIRLSKAIAVICVMFIFVKIYQHNRCISLSYEQQKLEQKKKKLLQEKNHLLVTLAQLKNREDLLKWAYNERNMTNLNLSNFVLLN